MVQYILNLSAIWLLSLIVFDIFLRRDTYHTYNRLYLIFTLIMGICLPLWTLQNSSVVYSNDISQPMVQNAATIKQTVVESATVQSIFNWQYYILVLYGIGVAIGLLFLIKDMILITRLYASGDKTKDGVWTIVETGKEHTPFSAFRYVFISNKNNYSADELRMVLSHEEQHGHALHFIDLLLIQLAKVILWFHPLIYIYYNRLITVHEYQADAAVDRTPTDYGKFLVEQAILQSAPALTHSFNRSPIKKRILMLTRKTSAIAKSKTLIVAPLVLICCVFFTQMAFSIDKKKKGDIVICNGNKFKLWAPPADTVIVLNVATGKEAMKISGIDSFPKTMNEKPILKEASLEPIYTGPDGSIELYIFNNVKKYIDKLPNDRNWKLYVNNTVIDEKGTIVFITSVEFYNRMTAYKPSDEEKAIMKTIETETEQLLFGKKLFNPAMQKDKPAIFNIGQILGWSKSIAVENHNSYLYTPADK